jgi:hypothetical protein
VAHRTTPLLRELQATITVDGITGECVAYLVERQDDGQAKWLADESFGPFDTGTDVGRWLGMALARTGIRPLR